MRGQDGPRARPAKRRGMPGLRPQRNRSHPTQAHRKVNPDSRSAECTRVEKPHGAAVTRPPRRVRSLLALAAGGDPTRSPPTCSSTATGSPSSAVAGRAEPAAWAPFTRARASDFVGLILPRRDHSGSETLASTRGPPSRRLSRSTGPARGARAGRHDRYPAISGKCAPPPWNHCGRDESTVRAPPRAQWGRVVEGASRGEEPLGG